MLKKNNRSKMPIIKEYIIVQPTRILDHPYIEV
jgi:hypothetical protein